MAIAVGPGETSGYEPLGRDRGEFNDSFNCVGGTELIAATSALPRPNANKWPAQPAGLRASTEAYMAAMHAVGRRVLAHRSGSPAGAAGQSIEIPLEGCS